MTTQLTDDGNTSNTRCASSLEKVREEKQLLRKEIRTRLRKMTSDEITEQSAMVWKQAFALPQYQSAKSVGLFVSMPSGEIQTDEALNKILLEDQKILYVPRVGLDFEKCDMSLIKVTASHVEPSDDNKLNATSNIKMFYDDWPRNKWNIPEPPIGDGKEELEAHAGDIDLLFVPGCAFDSNGNRLGQGKGYYDRFIHKVSVDDPGNNGDGSVLMKRKPVLVAVGLQPQFLGNIPSSGETNEGTTKTRHPERFVPIHDHDKQMDVLVFPQCTLHIS